MSGLKAVVLGAAAVVGVIVLMNGFNLFGSSVPVSQGVVVSPSPTTTTPTKSPRSPKPVHERPSPSSSSSSSPAVDGVRLGVYNATSTANLAQTAQASFQAEGYTIKQIGNATNTEKTSLVYYVKVKDQESATALADKNFKGVTAAAMPTDLTIKDENGVVGPPAKGVQVVVILGEDYKAK